MVTPLISQAFGGKYYLHKLAEVNIICTNLYCCANAQCYFLPVNVWLSFLCLLHPPSFLSLAIPSLCSPHTYRQGCTTSPLTCLMRSEETKSLPGRLAWALSLAPPQHISFSLSPTVLLSPNLWCSVEQISGWISSCNLLIEKFQKNTCQKCTTWAFCLEKNSVAGTPILSHASRMSADDQMDNGQKSEAEPTWTQKSNCIACCRW